ncbi:MAG: hypothetical protein ACP5VE_10140 [Chthonomonadales bacterium]
MDYKVVLLAGLLGAAITPAGADVVKAISLAVGSAMEQAALYAPSGCTEVGGARQMEKGGSFLYRLPLVPGAKVELQFTVTGDPAVAVSLPNGKHIPIQWVRRDSVGFVRTTIPQTAPVGGLMRFIFRAPRGTVTIRDAKVTLHLPDRDRTGLGDHIVRMMNAGTALRPSIPTGPTRPHTSFQTGEPWQSRIAVPTDAVLAYTDAGDIMRTWADAGYVLQTMGGFRDGPAYAKAHPDEVQTDRNGNALVIGGNSYYMVPTQARVDWAVRYFEQALRNGSEAVCPEEPEMFTAAGYSEAFKREWLARYGTPWQPPHSSVDARWKAEQLKGYLERRQIEAILDDAQRVKPSATRMVAVHSPVTYYQWGIPVPHYALLQIPSLQEMIGQVWTGTARSPARVAGVRSERTFEVGYLEYSSLYNLVRGTGKRMWFLMDPVEDNPDRPMQDYHINYEQTLIASLMFPQVHNYEVMPWPQRVYGRVPPAYATEINTVVGTLCDLWRYPAGSLIAGSPGVGTFYADSMGWQRGDPSPSDYDGFYGLCLPFVLRGVPVELLSLDRSAEPGYLDRMKVLLLSYEFLKPASQSINRSLAAWVRQGGSLVVFGGKDPYSDVSDAWWKKAGYPSPVDELFAQMGLAARLSDEVLAAPGVHPSEMATLLAAAGTYHNLENRKKYTLDLTPYVQQTGSVSVLFGDATPNDGWGALVASAELRIGSRLAAAFTAGSELETRFLSEDHGSMVNTAGRFADGNSYWVYRFDNLPRNQRITLTVDMGNGFLVKASPSPPAGPVLEAASDTLGAKLAHIRVEGGYEVTPCAQPSGATVLYRLTGTNTPVVWSVPVGKGRLVFAGIAPGWLTLAEQGSLFIRALARYCYGDTYREASGFVADRGPVKAVRSLGKAVDLEGSYVDLLQPSLPLVQNPTVSAHSWGLYLATGPLAARSPRLLAASGRVRARLETKGLTSVLVQAPADTIGCCRVWTGGRHLLGAKAFTYYGEPVPVTILPAGDTLLAQYPNNPDGVVLRMAWR